MLQKAGGRCAWEIKLLSLSGLFLLPFIPTCLALGRINKNQGKLRLGVPGRAQNAGVRGADGQGGMLGAEHVSAPHNLGMLEGVGERGKHNE